MSTYTGVAFPLLLIACAVLALAGIAVLIAPSWHRVLRWATPVVWVAVALHMVVAVIVLVSGNDAGMVLTIGYLLASVALMPLLGIGRLGTPAAKARAGDDRPVLAPDQVARVDAVAALIVGVALAVLAWRVSTILAAGA